MERSKQASVCARGLLVKYIVYCINNALKCQRNSQNGSKDKLNPAQNRRANSAEEAKKLQKAKQGICRTKIHISFWASGDQFLWNMTFCFDTKSTFFRYWIIIHCVKLSIVMDRRRRKNKHSSNTLERTRGERNINKKFLHLNTVIEKFMKQKKNNYMKLWWSNGKMWW